MILACYVATGFGVAAVYAFGMLRGKRDDYHRKGLMLAMAMGVIAIPLADHQRRCECAFSCGCSTR